MKAGEYSDTWVVVLLNWQYLTAKAKALLTEGFCFVSVLL
jgi:hypothetical protein